MEELVDERQFREPHDRHGVEASRAVVEHHEFGGDQYDTVLLVPVHRCHHVGDRRDALVVDALLEHRERSGVGQAHRPVAETLLGDTEVDGHALRESHRIQRDSDVADACARCHPRHIGDRQELGRGSVEASAARPDPDADRDGCRGDTDEQVFDDIVVDHGSVAVDLEDQRLGSIALGAVDRFIDGVDEDRVEVAAHLEDVDAARAVSRVGIALGLNARTEQCEPGHQREHADR